MEQVPAFEQNINKNAFFNIIFKNKIVKIFMIRIFYSENPNHKQTYIITIEQISILIPFYNFEIVIIYTKQKYKL